MFDIVRVKIESLKVSLDVVNFFFVNIKRKYDVNLVDFIIYLRGLIMRFDVEVVYNLAFNNYEV